MFFIVITTSKRIESAICRRNLFREKEEIKEAEMEYARLARVLKDFRDGGGEGEGGNGEKERPAGIGSEENPDGKALSSRS